MTVHVRAATSRSTVKPSHLFCLLKFPVSMTYEVSSSTVTTSHAFLSVSLLSKRRARFRMSEDDDLIVPSMRSLRSGGDAGQSSKPRICAERPENHME